MSTRRHRRGRRSQPRVRTDARPAPRPGPASEPAPAFPRTVLAVATGAAASALVVTAPWASGSLLDVVSATAAGVPQRALTTRRPLPVWLDGLVAWGGALAYLLPGVVLFGGAAVWIATTRAASPDARDAAVWGLTAAAIAYAVAASTIASAAVVEFAVRRRPSAMFDVTQLLDRMIRRPGFAAAWARTTGLILIALLFTAASAWMVALPPLAILVLGSFALFLAEVPAAFMWGVVARDAYGLLASVPEADSPEPARSKPASSPWG